MLKTKKTFFFWTMNAHGNIVLLEMNNPPEKKDKNVIELNLPETQKEIKLLRARG